MGGESKITFELSGVILAVLLMLLLLSAILFISNPDLTRARLIVSESSYISSIISNSEEIQVKLNYEDIDNLKIKENENEIIVESIDSDFSIKKSYLGNVKIKDENGIIIKN